jgi:transposase
VTGGQVHDSQVVGDVLDTPRPPLAITADKAYDSEKVRQQIKDEGALPVIPSRSNATRKAYCPKRFYRRRHKIENYFCRIKDWRRIATRYDKLARNFLAAAALVGALYWIGLGAGLSWSQPRRAALITKRRGVNQAGTGPAAAHEKNLNPRPQAGINAYANTNKHGALGSGNRRAPWHW